MKPYFLTACAVIKNEYPYVLEWIAFHRLVGVEHFYLYDNGSNDGTYELLEKLSITKPELITVYDVRHVNPVQLASYTDCLYLHRKDSEWIAFIDVDEFLYSLNYPDLKEFIKSIGFFANYNIGAIAAHWYLFGSNGHTEKTNGLVIERFTRRQPDANLHVKSIVRTDAALSVGKDPHTFYLIDGFTAVNERGVALPRDYALTKGGTGNSLRCNHYHTKSHAEYIERKKLGDPQTLAVDVGERLEERFRAHDRNDVEDTYLKDKYSKMIETVIVKELI